jgi:acetyl-CoA carboxylase biotin carboxyl carrier protein
MKLLNEIESDASGTVKAILVENGQPWSTASRFS